MTFTPETTGNHSDKELSPSEVYGEVFSQNHELKTELYKIVQKDQSLFEQIQASPSGYWYVDLTESKRFWCSPAFWIALGFPAEGNGVQETADFDPLRSQDQKLLEPFLQRLRSKAGSIESVELHYQHKKGNSVRFVSQIIALGDEKGEVVRLLGLHHLLGAETTQQNLEERELKFYKDLVDASQLGVWEWDSQNELIRFNDTYAEQLGYTQSELAPLSLKKWRTMVHPEDLDQMDAIFQKHEQKKLDRFEATFRVLHKEGRYVDLRNISKILKRDDSGKALEMVGTHQDVTVLRNAERHLMKTQKFLERTNRVGKVGYWEYDVKEGKLFWSDVTRKIHGVAEDFQPTVEEAISFYKAGKDREIIFELFQNCVDHKTPYDHDFIIIDAQGKEKWVRTIGQAEIMEGQDEVRRVYGVFQDIDRFVKARHELEVREEELNAIFSSSASGIATMGLKGNLIRINDRFCALLGYAPEEAGQLNFHDIVPHEEIEKHQLNATDLIEGVKSHIVTESTFLKKDGSRISVIQGGGIVRDTNGSPLFFTLEFIDVTDLRQLSAQLKVSEQRFKGIFDTAFQFIGFLDTKGTLLEANETSLAFADLSLEDVVGKKFWDTPWWQGSKETVEELKNAIQKASSGEMVQYLVKVKDSEGKLRTIDFSLKPMVGESGHVDYLVAEGRRIQEIIEAREEAERARDHLEAVFNASTKVSIIETDREGRIQYVNRGAEQLLGWKKKELLGEYFQEIIIPPEELTQWEVKIKEESPFGELYGFDSIIEKVRVNDLQGIRTLFARKDGVQVPVLLTISSFRLDGQDSYLAFASDFTAFEAAQNEVQTLLSMTQNQNERLMNFAHIVSHNLRSHSSNISMLLDLMESETPEATKNEFFPMLGQASKHLKETIAHLNDIVSINLTDQENLQEVRVMDTLNNVVATLNAKILEAQAEVIIDVDKDLELKVIPAYWESVLLNLTSNALKYRSPERKARIRVSNEREGNYQVLSVQDNGLGIDLTRYGDKIFGMYKTFHQNEDARGIGLFITKNQIEAMGGKIELQSEVGLGSQFKVYMPI